MSRTGVLKSEQMGAAFSLLRSRDLLWTPAVNSYLRGKRESPNDLMAWNADGTRMPCRMHAEYLRQLYLNNALARGEFMAEGRRVDLAAIQAAHVRRRHGNRSRRAVEVGLQGARLDALGGLHIFADIGRPQCGHRQRARSSAAALPRAHLVERQRDARAATRGSRRRRPQAGSWWPVWQQWLAQHSTAAQVAPPTLGSAAAGYPPIARCARRVRVSKVIYGAPAYERGSHHGRIAVRGRQIQRLHRARCRRPISAHKSSKRCSPAPACSRSRSPR